MAEPAVRVYGLAEVSKALRAVGDKDTLGQLKDANRVVSEMVVTAAQGRASTRMEKRAAATLESARTLRAGVKFGAGFAGAFGAEFGAGRNQPRRVNHFGNYTGWNQFGAWTGNGAGAGNFLWPAIREEGPAIVEAYAEELRKLFGE